MNASSTLVETINDSHRVGLDASRQRIEAWIRKRPQDHRGHFALGLLLANHQDFKAAISAYRNALQLRPNDVKTWSNLSNALVGAGAFEAAQDAAEHGLRLGANSGGLYLNLGNAAARLGRYSRAAWAFRKAMRNSNELVSRRLAQCNLGMLQLLKGRFKRGWRNFDARDSAERAPSDTAVWRGQQIAGQRLLVRTEQGLGDMIMFARFFPQLQQLGARLAVAAPSRLIPLLQLMNGAQAIEFVAKEADWPSCDFATRMMSVARWLGVDDAASIPAPQRYLAPAPRRVAEWRQRLRPWRRFRVGVAWRGSPANAWDAVRSAPIQALAPLAGLDCELVNLQWDGQQETPGNWCWRNIGKVDRNGAMLDTSAIIESLDAVVTVDTAVAHLSAAAGKPTWLALSTTPDWRWGLTGDRSPWYPSIRLFRQTQAGEWIPLFKRLTEDLRRFSMHSAAPN